MRIEREQLASLRFISSCKREIGRAESGREAVAVAHSIVLTRG